jgi:plasmid maintenance system antidote protein VapI
MAKKLAPKHPGEVLREEFLIPPYQRALSPRPAVPRARGSDRP